MPEFSEVRNLRRRYILALSTIAVLVSGAWLGMQIIVDKQRNFSQLVRLSGEQSGLSDRIAHFAAQMVSTTNEDDFMVAKAQLGRAISAMEASHKILMYGDAEQGIPLIRNDALDNIYFDPAVGLNTAVHRYLGHARTVYKTPRDELTVNSASYVFLLQYGPYVLDAIFSAATEEYELVSRTAIERIKQLETILWLATLTILALEAWFIFRPLERRLRQSLNKLTDSNTELMWHLNGMRQARKDAEEARDELESLNRHLEMRVDIRTRELQRELERHEKTEARLRRSTKELEAANRAKSDFLANMSHELRTPLNAIIGFSNMLRTEVFGELTNPKQREYVDDIHNSGKHLLELIKDILDVSALEAGKVELHETDLHLPDLVEQTCRLVMARAAEKGVLLRTEAPGNLPALHADERRLKQVLLNLLTNAIKFTPEGGEVVLAVHMTPLRNMSITVTDTGIGMDKDEVEKAMTMFGQIDSPFSRAEEGTGLGLPLSKGLVELHGGSLIIASKKDAGTRVTVQLPCERMVDMPTNKDQPSLVAN